MPLTLNLAYSEFSDFSDDCILRTRYEQVLKHSELIFRKKVDTIRFGEEFCSRRIEIFDAEKIKNSVELCHSLGVRRVEFVFPVIFQKEINSARHLLEGILSNEDIDCVVLNNWGLIHYANSLNSSKKMCMGRMLPIYTISPYIGSSLFEIDEIIRQKSSIMKASNCNYGDVNAVFPSTGFMNCLLPENINFFFPFVYMTSSRECLYSLCHSENRVLSCEEECHHAMMIADLRDCKVPVYQIGNSIHFVYPDFQDYIIGLSNVSIIYTPLDFVLTVAERRII